MAQSSIGVNLQSIHSQAASQAAASNAAGATTPGASSAATLFPPLENPPAPLDTADKYNEIVQFERSLVSRLNELARQNKTLEHVINPSMLPSELVSTNTKRTHKRKIDPLNRIKNLPNEEVEDEEEQEDEEKEEEEERVEDEEEDAGGDYLVSHFDNGEGYEDNDDEGDDMTSVI